MLSRRPETDLHSCAKAAFPSLVPTQHAFLCLASRLTSLPRLDERCGKPQPSAALFRAEQRLRLDKCAILAFFTKIQLNGEWRPAIQERIASIACAIKMPTLKITRKMSNQVLTSTSCLGSEPSCLCTVKGIT